MPLMNEHAARLRDPNSYDRIRRENDHFGEGIHVLWGIKIREGIKTVTEIQTLYFDATRFTSEEAIKWLADHDHKPTSFESVEKRGTEGDAVGTRYAVDHVIYREGSCRGAVLDEEDRIVELSFSSERARIPRSDWRRGPFIETLGHKKEEIDLKRLNNGAPLLHNHGGWFDTIGRTGVVLKAWVDDKEKTGRARVKFSRRNAEVDGVWQDVLDEILVNTSVGYRVKEMVLTKKGDPDKNQSDEYRVTSWEPVEISVVDMPADPSVGIGRDEPGELVCRMVNLGGSIDDDDTEEEDMPDKDKVTGKDAGGEGKDTTRGEPKDDKGNVINLDSVKKTERTEERKRIQERSQMVRGMFKPFGDKYRELMDKCVDDLTLEEEDVRKLLLTEVGKESGPLGDETIRAGDTQEEKFIRGAEEAVLVRSNLVTRDSEEFKRARQNEFYSMTLLEMARAWLRLNGVRTEGLNKLELVGRAFTTRSSITHSTSDFPAILENIANKAMLRGWDEQEETFPRFTRAGNLSDFKQASRVGLNAFQDLDEVGENGEFKYGTIGERKETIQLLTYGKLFSIGRQTIINDDLDAFTRIPRTMGRAAKRKVGDLVFNVLLNNQTMTEDATALYDAGHNNLAAVGAVPSETTVDAGRQAMALQTDANAVDTDGNVKALNIRPVTGLCGVVTGSTFRKVIASTSDPAAPNEGVPNTVKDLVEVVDDARIDASAEPEQWHLLASPTQHDLIEVGYLDGSEAPFLDRMEGWKIDGTELKVRIDAAARALDFRTFYKNVGA